RAQHFIDGRPVSRTGGGAGQHGRIGAIEGLLGGRRPQPGHEQLRCRWMRRPDRHKQYVGAILVGVTGAISIGAPFFCTNSVCDRTVVPIDTWPDTTFGMMASLLVSNSGS